MLNWRALSEHSAAAKQAEALLHQRGVKPERFNYGLELARQWRAVLTKQQELQQERRKLSDMIAAQKRQGRFDTEDLERAGADLRSRIEDLAEQERMLNVTLETVWSDFPNLPAEEVPIGKDESGNRQVREWRPTGSPTGERVTSDNLGDAISGDSRVAEDCTARMMAHDELGAALGLMDFPTAGRLSGSRFVVLSGALAQLERALGQFMLDLHCREHGYSEYALPLLVRESALFGTGQLPRFRDDQFHTQTGHWLIPTAEVPLTNLVANSVLMEDELPLRMAALTPCFRAEAGAAGKDTRGMIRQHQFWKVELVSITSPERSNDEHERLTACAETILRRLELPFRVMLLCRGDMGFASMKTYDLEVWMPGQRAYREISSCSNCGDFQARRMRARYRSSSGKKPRLVHTLNGSGVALGRCLIAVMENYQQPDGSILIPAALRPYMGGREYIG